MIALHEISLRFEDKTVLDRFSLTLPGESVTCLLGPSGCGKTTLLRLLAGLIRPDSGHMEGLPARPVILFQEDRLLPGLSVLQNVAAVTERDNALRWIEAVGLAAEAHTRPAELSGGMRRRAALARALACEGDLLLLDEPFTGLDPALAERMCALCLSRGLPILAVTHNAREAEWLHARTLRFSGPPLHLEDGQNTGVSGC